METVVLFDADSFAASVSNGECTAPAVFSSAGRISRLAYSRLVPKKGDRIGYHMGQLRQRVSPDLYGRLLSATSLSLRAAATHFPAYRFLLGEFLNDEWLALVDWHKPFHRDHVMHQAMCYHIARTLVQPPATAPELLFVGKSLRDLCVRNLVESSGCEYLRRAARQMGVPFVDAGKPLQSWFWSCAFDEALFLACMFHDIGYPWQFMSTIAHQLSPHGVVLPQVGNPVEVYTRYRDRLVLYPLNGYAKSDGQQPATWTERAKECLTQALSVTHGGPGALAFLYLNDAVREYPKSPDDDACARFCREWAAMAILMHDCQKVYAGKRDAGGHPANPQLRLSLERDPLSFVIALVDQLQDFGRVNARFEQSDDSKNISVTYDSACGSLSLAVRADGILDAQFFYPDYAVWLANHEKHKPDAQLAFFDSTHGYLDCRGLGVKGVELNARYGDCHA